MDTFNKSLAEPCSRQNNIRSRGEREEAANESQRPCGGTTYLAEGVDALPLRTIVQANFG